MVHKSTPRGTHFRRAGPRQMVNYMLNKSLIQLFLAFSVFFFVLRCILSQMRCVLALSLVEASVLDLTLLLGRLFVDYLTCMGFNEYWGFRSFEKFQKSDSLSDI